MKMKEGLERYRPELGDPGEWFRKCATEVAVFCNHKKVSTLKKIKEQYSHVTTITNYIIKKSTTLYNSRLIKYRVYSLKNIFLCIITRSDN
jgi:hypothetical protein